MTYCIRTAYWMFHDAVPNIVEAPLLLIFRMWQRASHLLFRNNTDLWIHFGPIWQCSPLIAEWVWLKIVDTVLTLTLITSKQPMYTQELYATNDKHMFDIQYYIRMYHRLHQGVLLPLNFGSTAIYTIWVRNDLAYYILALSDGNWRHIDHFTCF